MGYSSFTKVKTDYTLDIFLSHSLVIVKSLVNKLGLQMTQHLWELSQEDHDF